MAKLQLERLRKSLAVLQDISLQLESEPGLNNLLDSVVNLVVEFLEVKRVSIMILDDSNYLRIAAFHGMTYQIARKVRVKVGHGISGYVTEKKTPLLIQDVFTDLRFKHKYNKNYESNSLMCVPMIARNKVVGVINVNDKISGNTFDKIDIELLTIVAGHTAAVIENYRLYSELKATADHLHKSNQFLINANQRTLAVIDYFTEAIIVTDTQGIITLVSKNAKKFFSNLESGLNFQTVMNKYNLESWIGNCHQRVNEKQNITEEIDILIEGQKKRFRVHFKRIESGTKANCQIVNIFKDITFERNLTDKKQEFISLISHELRTPITVLNTYLSLLRSGELSSISDITRDVLDNMSQAMNRLHNDVDNLIIMSKLDQDSFLPDIETFNLGELIKKHTGLFQKMANNKGINFSCDIEPDLPFVVGDPTLIRVVIRSLAINAIKFTDSGCTVEIKAGKYQRQNGSNYVRIAVYDQGPGISPADIERIFNHFEQVERHMTRGTGGVGLGLTLAQRIMNLIGGEISIESIIGKGSCFSLCLKTGDEGNP
ncbi:GAF domain-containing sensor histidine kinase [bacterium]|nr:GAF domain-containing sensor histidine kinase [bacterium]